MVEHEECKYPMSGPPDTTLHAPKSNTVEHRARNYLWWDKIYFYSSRYKMTLIKMN